MRDAAVAFGSGDTKSALDILNNLIKANPSSTLVAHNLAVVNSHLGIRNPALSDTWPNPGSHTSELNTAILFFRSGDFSRALETLDRYTLAQIPELLRPKWLMVKFEAFSGIQDHDACCGLLPLLRQVVNKSVYDACRVRVDAFDQRTTNAQDCKDVRVKIQSESACAACFSALPEQAVQFKCGSKALDMYHLAVLNLRWTRYAASLMFLNIAKDANAGSWVYLDTAIAKARAMCELFLGRPSIKALDANRRKEMLGLLSASDSN